MKPKHFKDLLVKVIIVGLVLLAAPLAVPYAIELVVMLDIAGLEAALMLLLLQTKPVRSAILLHFKNWMYHFGVTILLIAGMYMFQMDAYIVHTLGSAIVLACTCSLLAALAIWLPAIYLSHKRLRSSYITTFLITHSASSY